MSLYHHDSWMARQFMSFSASPRLDGTLCMHAQGVMRVRSPSCGGCWVPVFDTATARKAEETFWPVGLTAHDMRCIVCSPANPVPQVRTACMHSLIANAASFWAEILFQ